VKTVRLFQPETAKPRDLPFERGPAGVSFVVPEFDVYGVVEVRGRGVR
jgi:hypothetical protein